MFVTCPACNYCFDDFNRSTICPHVGIGYCELCDCVICVCDPAEKARRHAARVPAAPTPITLDGLLYDAASGEPPSEPTYGGIERAKTPSRDMDKFWPPAAAADKNNNQPARRPDSCYWTKGHDGDSTCQHAWNVSPMWILTFPGKRHRTCTLCGRRECVTEERLT